MDDFRGEEAQYNRLREALRRLYALNIKSGQLERMVEEEAARIGVGAMTRTDIDKFRKGEVGRPRYQADTPTVERRLLARIPPADRRSCRTR
jgi:hypothetical protein